MPYRVRVVRDLVEYRTAVNIISHYFGRAVSEEDAERFARLLPFDRLHVTVDGAEIVGSAGVFPFELTVPGGPIRCAGVTVVGVLPAHRRRGLLTRMMRAQLDDVRERGEPIAALWASDEAIYGRYGYGLASLSVGVRADLSSGLRAGLPPREGRLRLVDHDDAARMFPRVYEGVRRAQPGFISRSAEWWDARRLDDEPERRRGGGPLNRVLLELDGRPAGYALYRIVQTGSGADWNKTVRVLEAIGVDARATRELWRYLLEIDWMNDLEAWLLPIDHPLWLLVARINLLRAKLYDGLWLRPVDVGAALSARDYRAGGRVTLEITLDPQFPGNVGTWTIDDGIARQSRRRPDVRLDVQALGSVYLGGFTFGELARAERVEEVARGGLARADAVFGVDAAPWCPEIF
jgi:predicted acetyltransferase